MTRGDLLGWTSFLALLARFAVTPPGRDRVLALTPSIDPPAVRAALAETAEARAALRAEGPPPWAGLADVRDTLRDAGPEGAQADGAALAALGRSLAAAARLGAYGARIRSAAPAMAAHWTTLPLCGDLAATLAR
ncbi:MAG TPA: hypothetical protein VLD61_01185, partial [Methylomirabilota bacterium]|nr:hypothetical protein [Methylomirabilota bacterium]